MMTTENKIQLDPNLVNALDLGAEVQAVKKAHTAFIHAMEVVQKKLDGNPLASHLAKSVSFDAGSITGSVSLRVGIDGIFAVVDGAQNGADVTAKRSKPGRKPGKSAPTKTSTSKKDKLTANAVRDRAVKLGFNLGDRPLRSLEEKQAAWSAMDSAAQA